METLESRFLLDGSRAITIVPIRAYAAIQDTLKSPTEPEATKPTTVVPIRAYAAITTTPVGTLRSPTQPVAPIFISYHSLNALAANASGSTPSPSSTSPTPPSIATPSPDDPSPSVVSSGNTGTSALAVTTVDGEPAIPGVVPIVGDTLTPSDLAASVPLPDQEHLVLNGPAFSVFDEAHSRLFVEGAGQDVGPIQDVIAGSSTTTETSSVLQAGPNPEPAPLPVPGVAVGPVVCMNWQLYRLQPGPNTNTINVVLRPRSTAGPLNEGVSVIDDKGHRLDEVFPNPNDGSISVDISTLMRGSKVRNPVFVQVFTFGNGSATTPQPLALSPYLMTITQQSVSSSPHFVALTPFAPRPSLPSGVLPSVSGKSVNTSANSLVISGQDANPGFVATSELTSSGLIPIPAATGPLPTRSAAPLGGVLDGDPIPQIDRLDAAKVDLELIGSGESGNGGEPRADEVVAEPQVGPDGPLVAVRGPGGFPLLASGLGDVRSFGSAASIAFMPWTSSPRLVSDPSATTRSDIERPETGDKVGSRVVRRSPAMFGLSLAMALGFGLVLPDLVSTFQQREPRRFRLRLRLLRGPRRDRV